MRTFSNFLRQATRSLGLEGKPTSRRFSSSPGQPVLGWMTLAGQIKFAPAPIVKRADETVALRLRQSVDTGTEVWLLLPSGKDIHGVVESCIKDSESSLLTVRITDQTRPEKEEQVRLGWVHMKWVNSQGVCAHSMVSIENAGEGQLSVLVNEEIPVPALILLSGYEFRSLGAVKQCEREDGHYRLIVELASELYPRATAA